MNETRRPPERPASNEHPAAENTEAVGLQVISCTLGPTPRTTTTTRSQSWSMAEIHALMPVRRHTRCLAPTRVRMVRPLTRARTQRSIRRGPRRTRAPSRLGDDPESDHIGRRYLERVAA